MEAPHYNIVFYRYNSICEADLINAFSELGINVYELREEMTDKTILNSRRVELVNLAIEEHRPLFVFSVNYFSALSQICALRNVLYLCLTVDSPLPSLFSDSIQKETNRLFYFDHAQFDRFSPYNPKHSFHMPLGAAVSRYNKVLSVITEEDKIKYGCDISFVGSLYNEKNPLKPVWNNLSERTKGFIDALLSVQGMIYGTNFMESVLTDYCLEEIKKLLPSYFKLDHTVADTERYVAAHEILGYELAERERINTLNALAKHFHITLFTRSDTAALSKVDVREGIQTHSEMPKVFNLSKINLNMTIRPIETGLPLRIFDILGCGGFVMTNYQAELPDLFTIGEELEAYSDQDELRDKCAYYLTHEEERKRIARKGYEKVAEKHTFSILVKNMLRLSLN